MTTVLKPGYPLYVMKKSQISLEILIVVLRDGMMVTSTKSSSTIAL